MTQNATTTEGRLDTLLQREDAALERLINAATEIEAEWAEGTRQVEELQRQAEQIRDDVRERTSVLEDRQAEAMLELAQSRSVTDLAALLGVSPAGAKHLLMEAQKRADHVQTPIQD